MNKVLTLLMLTTACSPRYTEEQCIRLFAKTDTLTQTITKDTIINIPGEIIRDTVTIDNLVTLTQTDTITQIDPKTGMELQIWKDKYGRLVANCSKRETAVVVPQKTETIKIIPAPKAEEKEKWPVIFVFLAGMILIGFLAYLMRK